MNTNVPRIGQLVRLLGSHVDGEVLAAARALARTLAAHDLDFHDLATAAIDGFSRLCRQGCEPLTPWQQTAQWCLRYGLRLLRTAETDFLRSMSTWPHEPTIKQAHWLSAIAAALGYGRAADK